MTSTSKVARATAHIVGLINAGQPGDRLPSESEIAAQCGVSRVTVRDALDVLWIKGRIVRRWGAGTFIADDERAPGAPVRNYYVSAHGVTPIVDIVHGTGHASTLLNFALEQAPVPEWVDPSTFEGGVAWKVTRCLGVDGVPGILIHDYVPLTIDGVTVDPMAFSDTATTLAKFFAGYGTRLVKQESLLSPVIVDAASARLLQLEVGVPVLFAHQRGFSDLGDVATCAEIYYRSDVFGTVLVRTIRE